MTVRRGLLTVLGIWFGVVAAITLHDLAVPTEREWSTRALLAAIGEYREHVSPRLTGRIQCRFIPTCSAYGLEAVRRYGAVRGAAKAAGRIASCGPWTEAGTVDMP